MTELSIRATELPGVLVVEPKSFRDERGFLIESFHLADYREQGITAEFVQDNHSRSAAKVLRGLHFQDRTAPMGKLVRCTVGAVLDVAVDVRVGSPWFGRWVSLELSAANMLQVWLPPGFAHGFLTLSDAAEVQYKCTTYYAPAAEITIAWDDPDIGITWPLADPILSQRDRAGMSLSQYRMQPGLTYVPADADPTARISENQTGYPYDDMLS